MTPDEIEILARHHDYQAKLWIGDPSMKHRCWAAGLRALAKEQYCSSDCAEHERKD